MKPEEKNLYFKLHTWEDSNLKIYYLNHREYCSSLSYLEVSLYILFVWENCLVIDFFLFIPSFLTVASNQTILEKKNKQKLLCQWVSLWQNFSLKNMQTTGV